MPIQVLSPEVASKIAAGEVILRPASVVKELIENALDAGATQIQVWVEEGGIGLIRVADNGAGIPAAELELAFQRHATSKVAALADLAAIQTLGFRGEALPSIAAAAEVTLLSRTPGEIAGSYITLKGGRVVSKGLRGCPPGTTVTVRNLFRTLPARLKFLRSPTTERAHISQLIGQYSLAFPQVRFSLTLEGRNAFESTGKGSLREALVAVYGPEAAEALLSIGEEDTEGQGALGQVWGYVSPPSLSRSTRSYLSFFVNRRWIQSRMLNYALEEAYQGLLMAGRHPIAALHLRLPPEETDVNVHPTKNEIRFRKEHEVFALVQKAVRSALLRHAVVPTLGTQAWAPPPEPAPAEAIPLALRGGLEGPQEAPSWPAQEAIVTKLPILRVLGQLAATYIIAEGPQGMYLIDQHAAHERILYERTLEQLQRSTLEVQGLLEPITVELSPQQEAFLAAHLASLSEMGFAIEHFGGRTYLVRSVPALLKGRAQAEDLLSLLDSLEEETILDFRDRVAISLACHAAIKAGQALSQQEIRELVRQLEEVKAPHICPHGRPTMIHLSSSQLEREFGRR